MQMTAIRASSLPELFDCPARWEAKHLCGRRLPRSAAAQLGTAVHAGAAVFDVQRILGSPITPDDAAGEVVDAIHHPREDVDWGEDSPREAERIALALHGLYCRDIAPARNYVAVEATCERLEITDLGLALTGTTDRITTNALGDLGIADIKTGKTAVAADGTVRTAGHAAQIGVYELLAGAASASPSPPRPRSSACRWPRRTRAAAPPWASSPAPASCWWARKNSPACSRWPPA